MRIISGIAGRREILVPRQLTRPSTDRLREALFSILNERIPQARVLDLFAGSGALGLESLSREAHSCDFVDASKESCSVVRKNLARLNLTGGTAHQMDALKFLRSCTRKYDIVFADPPYKKQPGDTDWLEQLLASKHLPSLLAPEGLLILEDDSRNEPATSPQWKLLDQRRYGGCTILIYQLASPISLSE